MVSGLRLLHKPVDDGSAIKSDSGEHLLQKPWGRMISQPRAPVELLCYCFKELTAGTLTCEKLLNIRGWRILSAVFRRSYPKPMIAVDLTGRTSRREYLLISLVASMVFYTWPPHLNLRRRTCPLLWGGVLDWGSESKINRVHSGLVALDRLFLLHDLRSFIFISLWRLISSGSGPCSKQQPSLNIGGGTPTIGGARLGLAEKLFPQVNRRPTKPAFGLGR